MATFEKRVVSGLDDVEQNASGSMYTNSSDLELVDDGAVVGQAVGIRFTDIDLPQGAIITNAYIQFQVDEVSTVATSLVIRGEDADSAAAFASATNNVSSRTSTDASVAWTPVAWSTVGAAGVDQRTPDLSAIVQEIVNRGGWSALNEMVFVITGTGTRTAESFEGTATGAPLLHIEYSIGAPVVGNISIGDVTISEGNSGTKTASFTVSRTGTAAFAVDFATADGTAAAASDYVATAGSLSFAAGQATQTIAVTINGDTTVEPNETLFVNLTNATNGGTILDGQGLGTITNDDAAAVVGDISIGDVTISEGNSGTKTASFTVSRTGTAAFAVDFATANGTAAAPADYVATAGSLSFAAGQATQTVAVTINGDTAVEPNETFFVNLANATNGGTILDGQGLGTITNDDATAVVGDISIGDVTISEGNSGTKTASFTVSRTGTAAFAVDFATANGTAAAPSDYVATAGSLSFAAGQATQTIAVTINGDTTVEPNETLFVNLTNATNGGTILDGQGLGTITNDDGSPTPTTFEKRVVSGLDDVEQNASGSMYTNSSDLELVDDGAVVGQTVGIRFTDIDLPQGAIITNAYIQFQVDEVSAVATSLVIRGEDADSAAAFASATNNVSSRTSTDATVAWTPVAWSTVGAQGLDQRTPDLSPIVQEIVNRGGWSALNEMVFVITGTGTRTAESFEGTATGAPLLHIEYSIGAPVVGNISIGDVTISEGNSGTKTATFTVSRTGTAAFAVDFATADGTAAAPSDYVATAGSLSFAAGQATQTVAVTINADTAVEPNETFFVNLANATNGGTILDGQGLGTITDDDAPAVVGNISIGDVTISEGNSGTKTASFTVSRTGTAAFTVDFATANGTAAAPSDYVTTAGSLSFAAGQATQTVSVTINGDTAVEPNETFFVNLTNATNGGTILDAQGLGTITNDDGISGPTVVAVHAMSAIGSADPSGLAYVPSLGTLFLSDSEAEEEPFFRSNNLFALNLDGTLKANGAISLLGFTDEPTGLAYDPGTNHLYVSDDDRFEIFWVNPANPTVKLGEFATDNTLIHSFDPEDVAVNPTNGHLFISNGSQVSSSARTIVETNNTGTQVFSTITLPSIISDPEALGYDPTHDVFFVGGGFSNKIWIVSRSGAILDTIDILSSFRSPISGGTPAVKDLELAPSSNPNDDPATLSLYVADYGAAHETDANDGRLFEISNALLHI